MFMTSDVIKIWLRPGVGGLGGSGQRGLRVEEWGTFAIVSIIKERYNPKQILSHTGNSISCPKLEPNHNTDSNFNVNL